MVEAKRVVGISGAIGISAVDTYLLRKYVDKKTGVKKLGRFGQPSVLVNLGTGLPTLGLGLAGMLGKGPLKRNSLLRWVASSYGTAATAGGIFGVVSPTEGAYATTAAARRVAARERVALKQRQVKAAREPARKPAKAPAKAPAVAPAVGVAEQFM